MLGMTLTSERFERLLFKIQTQNSTSKPVVSPILASIRPHKQRKSNIVIISNGVEQNQNKPRRKKYVFSQDEFAQENSEAVSFSHQKKHIIKKQKKQDPDYSIKRQKNDRNVVSNIIHHLMKHSLTALSDETLSNIITKKGLKLSTMELRRIMEQKEKICKTYITNKHLKLLWDDPELPQFSKAMRIISRIFLQNYSFLKIFNGNKLNKQSKAIHYKGRRELLQFLLKSK